MQDRNPELKQLFNMSKIKFIKATLAGLSEIDFDIPLITDDQVFVQVIDKSEAFNFTNIINDIVIKVEKVKEKIAVLDQELENFNLSALKNLNTILEKFIESLTQIRELYPLLNYHDQFNIYSQIKEITDALKSTTCLFGGLKKAELNSINLIDMQQLIEVTDSSVIKLLNLIKTDQEKIAQREIEITRMAQQQGEIEQREAILSKISQGNFSSDEEVEYQYWKGVMEGIDLGIDGIGANLKHKMLVLLNHPEELDISIEKDPALLSLHKALSGYHYPYFTKLMIRAFLIRIICLLPGEGGLDPATNSIKQLLETPFYITLSQEIELYGECDNLYTNRFEHGIKNTLDNLLVIFFLMPKQVKHIHFRQEILPPEEFSGLLKAVPLHVNTISLERLIVRLSDFPMLQDDSYIACFPQSAIPTIIHHLPKHIRHLVLNEIEESAILPNPYDTWMEIAKSMPDHIEHLDIRGSLSLLTLTNISVEKTLDILKLLPQATKVHLQLNDEDYEFDLNDNNNRIALFQNAPPELATHLFAHISSGFTFGLLSSNDYLQLIAQMSKEIKVLDLSHSVLPVASIANAEEILMNIFHVMPQEIRSLILSDLIFAVDDERIVLGENDEGSCSFHNLNAEQVVRIMNHLPKHVIKLDLSNTHLFKAERNHLLSLLFSMPEHVKNLDLSCNNLATLNHADLRGLLTALSPHLETIILKENQFECYNTQALYCNLRQLDADTISKIYFDDEVHQQLYKFTEWIFNQLLRKIYIDPSFLEHNFTCDLMVGMLKIAPKIVIGIMNKLLTKEYKIFPERDELYIDDLTDLYRLLSRASKHALPRYQKEINFIIGEQCYLSATEQLADDMFTNQSLMKDVLFFLECAQDYPGADTLKLQIYNYLINGVGFVITESDIYGQDEAKKEKFNGFKSEILEQCKENRASLVNQDKTDTACKRKLLCFFQPPQRDNHQPDDKRPEKRHKPN